MLNQDTVSNFRWHHENIQLEIANCIKPLYVIFGEGVCRAVLESDAGKKDTTIIIIIS